MVGVGVGDVRVTPAGVAVVGDGVGDVDLCSVRAARDCNGRTCEAATLCCAVGDGAPAPS